MAVADRQETIDRFHYEVVVLLVDGQDPIGSLISDSPSPKILLFTFATTLYQKSTFVTGQMNSLSSTHT